VADSVRDPPIVIWCATIIAIQQQYTHVTMNVQKRNDVSIYCLSSGTTIPEWLGDRGRRNLSKHDESVRRRIELLQDFQMPASSSKLVQSANGRFIMAAGTYPPRIRCYDVHELSMKFERYVDATIVDMVLLGEDYGKVALLMDDRTIAFHAPYGAHTSVRVPTFGRALGYEPTTCELIVAAKGHNVYRLNLEEGRFSEPWTFEPAASSASCIAIHPCHPLAGLGCEDGRVRLWDARTPDALLQPCVTLDVASAVAGYGYAEDSLSGMNPHEIRSLAFDPSGLYMAAGTQGGVVALYDIRSSRPLYIQEHKQGLPIHTVQFHSGSGMVISSDEKVLKVWRYKSSSDMGFDSTKTSNTNDMDGLTSALGAVKVNIEGNGKLQHFIVAGDEADPSGNNSGLLLCATDQPKMDSFYVPALGVAPRWCSYLETITEELEERDLQRGELVKDGQETIYENYKFVSRDDLEKLGISNLVGTPLLRGYMHGFFMDTNLYNRVKAVANPFEYEEYQKKKLRERMEAKRSSRIAPRVSESKPKTAVNPALAERLENKATLPTKASKVARDLLQDDRFGSLFTNPDFHIDESDEIFKLRNPSGAAESRRKKDNLDSDQEDNDDDDEDPEDASALEDEGRFQNAQAADSDANSDESDSDEEIGVKVRGEAYESMKALNRQLKEQSKPAPKVKQPKVRLSSVEDNTAVASLGIGNASAQERAMKRLEELHKPLSIRLQEQPDDGPLIRSVGGNKEYTYVPKDTKRKEDKDDAAHGKRQRRGVKALRLKKLS
jgi:ribosome biogenesis protein ENP2